eukprot:5882357-Pyramimonas_sp.AAC.1
MRTQWSSYPKMWLLYHSDASDSHLQSPSPHTPPLPHPDSIILRHTRTRTQSYLDSLTLRLTHRQTHSLSGSLALIIRLLTLGLAHTQAHSQ